MKRYTYVEVEAEDGSKEIIDTSRLYARCEEKIKKTASYAVLKRLVGKLFGNDVKIIYKF